MSPADDEMEERAAFAERLRLQFAARHRSLEVAADPARLSLHLRGPGVDVVLPLSPLHLDCLRNPERTAALIADFVRASEPRLTPAAPGTPGAQGRGPSLGRVVWCVRSRDHLADFSRAAELLTAPLPADLVAFVAEALPGSYMRGVPRQEWAGASTDDEVRRAADANTEARFAALPERIRAAGRVARDGWRMGADPLFQGSVLMVPEVLRALVERAGTGVLIANPDRSLVLAIPSGTSAEEGFRRRVLRSWREGLNPVSRAVLVADGERLTESRPARAGARPGLMDWLRS
ncbi:MAG TPA: hypothetical protein VMU20_17455 [Candidatus Dormibacteraeota bacterium]|nr:hypothetical protein [Candidatus Dormibacteraeota bacterium]